MGLDLTRKAIYYFLMISVRLNSIRSFHALMGLLKTPNLDSRVRGNDRNVSFYALRALLHPFVIPAKAGIHELLEVPLS
jgi:hypothetical protein